MVSLENQFEALEQEKIEFEITKLTPILNDIKKVPLLDKNNYQDLYQQLMNQIKVTYIDQNLIDEKISNYLVQIVNDIFNYYLYGATAIPINDNVNNENN